MRFILIRLPVLLFLALTAPALASDGVLEINQTCAVQTGCLAGDTAGYPVTITAPGSYVLTSDLTVAFAGTTAIDVNISPISINLNGFSIRGVTSCSGDASQGTFSCTNAGNGVGINASFQSLTVRNGSVTGMGGRGIVALNDSLVENVHLSHNGELAIFVGWGSIVRGNTIRFNGGTSDGEDVNAGVKAGINALVIDNSISFVNGSGIKLETGRVAGNVLLDLAGNAVIMGSGVMEGNEVVGASGLGLSAGSGVGYGGNVLRANNSFGPQVSGGVQLGSNLCNTNTICP
jgi:hypothetical protein